MAVKKLRVGFNKRKLEINVYEVSAIGKLFGLMFKSRNCDNLLFDFNKETDRAIHSLFVFFPFLALWLDENNEIIEWRIVKPFHFSAKPKRKFTKLIEIPVNFKNRGILDAFIDGRNI